MLCAYAEFTDRLQTRLSGELKKTCIWEDSRSETVVGMKPKEWSWI